MVSTQIAAQTYNTTLSARPILKWAGGKKQLLAELLDKKPVHFNKYIEPFIGGGALYFSLNHPNSIIADSNEELINLYTVVANNVGELIDLVRTYNTDEETYYAIRALDIQGLSDVKRAARMLYLNKTCFNGLWRVNKQGKFNVPYGKRKNPIILNTENLKAASELLKSTTLVLGDYKQVLKDFAAPGDFIYLDPPYLPISPNSDFKRYTKEQFFDEDHQELAKEVKRLHELGCHVILSNSNHPLVYELYSEFDIDVIKTRRNINAKGNKRTGEDVLINIPSVKPFLTSSLSSSLPEQVSKYPSTRFMGSKNKILENIWGVASWFDAESVLDLFSGSGIVSYMFKAQGKQVISNDYMAFSATFTKALIENNETILTQKDIEHLLSEPKVNDHFVFKTFKDLYFKDHENKLIDRIRANIKTLKNKKKQSLAMASLVRACTKKRPRGIFTYTGYRYDDGRKDLQITLEQQFLNAIETYNNAVFDNGNKNKSKHSNALNIRVKADLVYIDPPYYSPHSDNEYVRRYHFIEGLACDWQGVEMQPHTKTKKFKSYPTPFSSRIGAHKAFDCLFERHKDSILIVSYSSNSLPTKDEMVSLMLQYKSRVEIIAVDYKYSFGNQGHKVGDNKNQVKEYLFVGFN